MKKLFTTGSSEKERQEAENEVKVLKSISHESIVKYMEYFFENNEYFLIMEFCSGGDLKNAINAQKCLGTPFSEEIVLIWFGQLISGLKYLKKRKILHRDLKPNNVFITSEKKIKIGDFGLAKTLDSTYEMAETRKGARFYMAPERLRGQRYNHKSDMWALGCILYEMCMLRYTFTDVLDILNGRYESIPDGLHPRVSVYVPKLLHVDSRRRLSADQILNMR